MTNDAGMKKYIDFQQKLIDEDLIDTKTANWSDDWNRELNDGTIASLTIGGWMPVNLMNGAPDQAGNWRVAQLPQWNEGDEVSAEDGGSALAVVSQSKQQAAAYKFVEYLTHGEGAQTMADTGTFPSLKSILTSKSFTDPNTEANKKVNDYFGGQNVNQVLSEAAQRKVSKFAYLRTTRSRSPASATRSPRPTARASPSRKPSPTTPRRSPTMAPSRATPSPTRADRGYRILKPTPAGDGQHGLQANSQQEPRGIPSGETPRAGSRLVYARNRAKTIV